MLLDFYIFFSRFSVIGLVGVKSENMTGYGGGSFHHIWLYLDHGLEYIWVYLYGFRVYLDVTGYVWMLFNVTWYVWLYAGGSMR